MNVDAHRDKAQRLERSLAKCGAGDFETIIEGAMLAATHWFNLLLHRRGLRAAENDVLHAEFVTVGERRKLALAAPAALQALDRIERSRTTHVRGDIPEGERAAQDALDCLATIRAAALSG